MKAVQQFYPGFLGFIFGRQGDRFWLPRLQLKLFTLSCTLLQLHSGAGVQGVFTHSSAGAGPTKAGRDHMWSARVSCQDSCQETD